MGQQSTPGHIPRENHDSKDACSPVFTEALFSTAKSGKHPKCPCPSTEKQMSKTQHIHTMESYSATRKKKNNAICSNIDWT